MHTDSLNRAKIEPRVTSEEAGKELASQDLPNPSGGNHTKKKLLGFALLGLTVVAGVGAWKWHFAGPIAPAPVAIPSVAVSAPLERQIEARMGFLGQFAAVEHVEIRPQVGGTLTQIYFKDGEIVRKGDPLFQIDPTPYEIKLNQATAQLEMANARLLLAKRELDRANELSRKSVIASQDVDQRVAENQAAQADVDNAKAAISDAKFDLDRCRITAPFTGQIGTHLVSVGNLVSGSRAATSPTTLLTTIVSLDPIYLNFDMSEADYLTFSRQRDKKKGELANKVFVSLSDEKTFSREGTLDFVDNAIDRSSGTIHARATLPNKDLLLTPGAFGRVRLALSAPKPTLLVPDASVLPDQSSHMVLTVDQDDVVTPKIVEIGDLRGGLRVIESGLDARDRVVVDSIPTTAPGSKINPTAGQIEFGNDQD